MAIGRHEIAAFKARLAKNADTSDSESANAEIPKTRRRPSVLAAAARLETNYAALAVWVIVGVMIVFAIVGILSAYPMG